METVKRSPVTVESTINVPVARVWEFWTQPEHIINWTHASDDWHVPYADNDLREGGRFKTTMAAKDGSFSFDFEGVYTTIKTHSLIEYTLGDERTVSISFTNTGNKTKVTQEFDPENVNSIEQQKGGWQAIIDNFKKYAEAQPT